MPCSRATSGNSCACHGRVTSTPIARAAPTAAASTPSCAGGASPLVAASQYHSWQVASAGPSTASSASSSATTAASTAAAGSPAAWRPARSARSRSASAVRPASPSTGGASSASARCGLAHAVARHTAPSRSRTPASRASSASSSSPSRTAAVSQTSSTCSASSARPTTSACGACSVRLSAGARSRSVPTSGANIASGPSPRTCWPARPWASTHAIASLPSTSGSGQSCARSVWRRIAAAASLWTSSAMPCAAHAARCAALCVLAMSRWKIAARRAVPSPAASTRVVVAASTSNAAREIPRAAPARPASWNRARSRVSRPSSFLPSSRVAMWSSSGWSEPGSCSTCGGIGAASAATSGNACATHTAAGPSPRKVSSIAAANAVSASVAAIIAGGDSHDPSDAGPTRVTSRRHAARSSSVADCSARSRSSAAPMARCYRYRPAKQAPCHSLHAAGRSGSRLPGLSRPEGSHIAFHRRCHSSTRSLCSMGM